MKRLLALAVCLALIAVCAAAEETDAYSLIEMTDTFETISEKLGAPAANDGEYADFGGVLCAFFDSGRLQAKMRGFDDVRSVAAPTNGDFAAAKRLKKGALLADVSAILGGEGEEIMRVNLSDEETSGVQTVLAWVNADSQVMEALFELDDGEWTLFAVVEITDIIEGKE